MGFVKAPCEMRVRAECGCKPGLPISIKRLNPIGRLFLALICIILDVIGSIDLSVDPVVHMLQLLTLQKNTSRTTHLGP